MMIYDNNKNSSTSSLNSNSSLKQKALKKKLHLLHLLLQEGGNESMNEPTNILN